MRSHGLTGHLHGRKGILRGDFPITAQKGHALTRSQIAESSPGHQQ